MNNKLIYTSYDGDNIPLIDSFIKLVIDFKYIPINPTKSLGYYISTSIHDNDKGECLRDCLSLEMICDELWVFIDNNKYIPEGVRLEIATWLKYKSSPVWIHRNLVTTVFIGFGVPNGSLNYILSKILVVFLSSSLNFSSNK
ncbi:TPA: hypothetical protein ACHBKV_002550 [Staphylococcus aureus]